MASTATTSSGNRINEIYPAEKYLPPTYTESGWVVLNMRRPYKWSNCLVNLFDRITCGWLTAYHNRIAAIAQPPPPNGSSDTKVLVGNVSRDEIVSTPKNNESLLDIGTEKPVRAIIVRINNPLYDNEDSSSSEDDYDYDDEEEDDIGDDDVFGSTSSIDSGVEGCER